MFYVCLDLDSNGETMACYHSFGYQSHHHKQLFSSAQTNYSRRNARRLSRNAYDKMKYFFDKSIIGSGDYYFVRFLIDKIF